MKKFDAMIIILHNHTNHTALEMTQPLNIAYRVPTLLLRKNPGLSRTPMRNFPGPFCSPRMFEYNETRKLC